MASVRRFDESRKTYEQVLTLDPRHPVALGLLGIVFHLSGDIDKAIVKYHEVCAFPFCVDAVI
jgi:anaphase-promoting complex subunit 6